MDNNVILVIRERQFECNKTALAENSEYFQVMFRGYFAERKQNIIELKVRFFKYTYFCIFLIIFFNRM